MIFNYDNRFAQTFICKNFTRPVNIAMLINQRVTSLVEKQLDACFKLIRAFYPLSRGGHFLRIKNRIGP